MRLLKKHNQNNFAFYLQLKQTKSGLIIFKKHKFLTIFVLAFLGFIYQGCTLGCMFSDDVLNAHDVTLWNGYFPWWTIFFTFTFWSNFFVFIAYVLYTFFLKTKLLNNNFFLLLSVSYISVTFLVVVIALFPLAIASSTNVNFTKSDDALVYAALIMPHGPGPIYFIFFSLVLLWLNPKGNQKIMQIGFWKFFSFLCIFFVAYMVMLIALNWINIGAYYFANNQLHALKGYSVYAFFTNINPNLPNVNNAKITGHGSFLILLFYLLSVFILFLCSIFYFFITKRYFIYNHKNTKIKQLIKLI